MCLPQDEQHMKLSLSNRALTIVLFVVLVLSVLNTALLFLAQNNSTYDYIIFRDGDTAKARNGTTGTIDYASTDDSYVINAAIAQGSNIYIKQSTYTLNSDIVIQNKKNAQIISDGAIINAAGKKIIIRGDNYTLSQYNLLSGLDIINGTVRIEDSFKTTITDMTFENSQTALELASNATWSEGTKIENSHFVDCVEGIVFRSPTGNATGSYANTEISRCYFNLVDNSAGIIVEPLAQFSDSLMQNVRIWQGENGERDNQTGILMRGTMKQTMLSSVVFESFVGENKPVQVYAINIDTNEINYSAPILAGGNSFLGTFTARVYNQYNKWIYGLGGLFKDNKSIAVGLNNSYGTENITSNYPFTIADFKAEIHVWGIASDESITVKLVFEFIDHSQSTGIEKTFTSRSDVWLNETEVISQYPSQNVLWAVLVTAKTDATATNAVVTLDVYGATT